MALISPRRLGKSGLIQHFFAQEDLKEKYHVFFADIYATTSLAEFVYTLGKAWPRNRVTKTCSKKRLAHSDGKRLSSLRLLLVRMVGNGLLERLRYSYGLVEGGEKKIGEIITILLAE